ncbi:pectin lyase-like protein [Trichodelitschia bisporula]|uniref:pectate lyase n=1 Tax=Trichodelitschia bisporula TaxID=703511 RepID=A0A6G1IBP2_9PEZI|nr:pectin lyase-like protein [Trichodelitschia bisporula]
MTSTRSLFASALLVVQAIATPTWLRNDDATAVAASVNDVATLGYASVAGGTTGGKGGQVVQVSTYEQLAAAASGNEPKIIVITGPIMAEAKTRVGSNKSFIGKNSRAELIGNGFSIVKSKNVIIRNLKISKVTAKNGDAVTVQASTHVWADHLDLSSDREHGKDFYDGLFDVTHGSDYVTLSNSHLHDHYKASLVGHSEKAAEEDTGHLHITYANNYWTNIGSRTPSLRFGTAHIFNSLFSNVTDGINARDGAQVLVQGNVFVGMAKPLYSVDKKGFAVASNNRVLGQGAVGGGESKAASLPSPGKLSSVPYKFDLMSVDQVQMSNPTRAGNTLTF